MADITLHNFYASSTSFRVRIALNLKGIAYDQVAWDLKQKEQKSEEYLKMNPQGLVPVIEREGKPILSQSLAIIEWLDESYPEPALLPEEPDERSRVRAIAYAISCDATPLMGGRIMSALQEIFNASQEDQAKWARTWGDSCFNALELQLQNNSQVGKFCHGDSPTLADICLAAQVIVNQRFEIALSPYPTIARIVENCMALKAFEQALPENQPDVE